MNFRNLISEETLNERSVSKGNVDDALNIIQDTTGNQLADKLQMLDVIFKNASKIEGLDVSYLKSNKINASNAIHEIRKILDEYDRLAHSVIKYMNDKKLKKVL